MNQPLISLCLIVGNVAEYIERCLTSFAPIADEIILVRAIGSQVPDETFSIATEVCGRLDISLTLSEYKNTPDHADWPHVDSFAAARNLSFQLASGTYAFWCDTDDILACDPHLIREHAQRGLESGTPVFIFPYDIFGRGVSVPRERMIRRDVPGAWIYPVHECYRFDEVAEGISDERVIVQHLPKPSKSGSMERNLRILESIPDSDMHPGLLYHLHCEQRGAGQLVKAIKTAQKALAHPDLGRPEKYELFINLASMCSGDQLHVAHQYLLQAYAADPCRREALGLLAATCIDAGRPADALAFARQMMATPRPSDWSWNDRAHAYGWIGEDILQQCLRANGLADDAENLRLSNLLLARGPRISLLHATRGRARKASATRKAWHDLAERPEAIEHIFAIDQDDPSSAPLTRFHHVIVPAGGGCVAAWNAAARISTGDILVQVSDDFMPPAKWDTEIIKRFGPDLKLPRVLLVSDGFRTDGLICIAILTRPVYEDRGHLFHPRFKSVFSDNWFTIQAARDGIIIDARDLTFEHLHPAAGKGEPDRTYAESNSEKRYAEGAAILAELLPVQTWRDIEGFFDYQDLYDRIAHRLQPGDTFVEVGVWCGRSINYLASKIKALGKTGIRLIAVDDFSGIPGRDDKSLQIHENGSLKQAFLANTKACGNDDVIELMEGDSCEIAKTFLPGSVFGVFIDGDHSAIGASLDIGHWSLVIKPDGILAGHDLRSEGVQAALHNARINPAPCSRGNCWLDSGRLNPFAPLLSILIPGIPERMEQTKQLIEDLRFQIRAGGFEQDVEILSFIDDRKRSVGAKRQALQDIARGDYIAFIDDDDVPLSHYIGQILAAQFSRPDVITFRQCAIINGVEGEIVFDAFQTTDQLWAPHGKAFRRPWHVCAWKRRLVSGCRFGDCNYGEDRIWVDQAAPLAKSHQHIPDILHIYRHSIETTAAPPPSVALAKDGPPPRS